MTLPTIVVDALERLSVATTGTKNCSHSAREIFVQHFLRSDAKFAEQWHRLYSGRRSEGV